MKELDVLLKFDRLLLLFFVGFEVQFELRRDFGLVFVGEALLFLLIVRIHDLILLILPSLIVLSSVDEGGENLK